MQVYQTVTGNNAPDLVITVQRNGTAIDVSGATVTLIITNERTGTVTNSVQTCTLTTPISGIVTYSPAAGDFATGERYLGEVKIVYSTGKIERLVELLTIVARTATS